MRFTDRELTALAEILSWYHRDRVIMGRPEQAELIKRLIQEIKDRKDLGMTIKELQRRRKNGASLEILADLAGCTIAEIREALGHSGGSYLIDLPEVDKKVHYALDTAEAMKLYEQGYNDREIAEQVGVSRCTVGNWRRGKGLPPNGALGRNRSWFVERAMKLYEQGYNDREIGEQVGASGWAIGHWRRGKGLPSNGNRGTLR